jgi:hypothetical protein
MLFSNSLRRCYLWTGDIDPALYAGDCLFTDPTLSFRGLATFRRNLVGLRERKEEKLGMSWREGGEISV